MAGLQGKLRVGFTLSKHILQPPQRGPGVLQVSLSPGRALEGAESKARRGISRPWAQLLSLVKSSQQNH